MNDYLIPANTKKGLLILGIFRPFDLILFGTGVLITLILTATLSLTSTLTTVIVITPALVTGFLVVPIPNYHNMLTVIGELIEFLTTQRKYEWKGWCYKNEARKKTNKAK